MTIRAWSFEQFSDWLRDKGNLYRNSGCRVDVSTNDIFRASIRLRIECGVRVGEIVVWSDGECSKSVIDLQTSDFVYMEDGVRLDGDWEQSLKGFFEYVDTSSLSRSKI